jgi:phosphatidylglycerophosphatase A
MSADSITPKPTGWADRMAVTLATGFGLGYFPKSPGTFGSLLGIVFGGAIHQDHLFSEWPSLWLVRLAQLALIVVSILVGIWCIHRTEALWNEHDSGKIVWDEVVGQGIAVLTLSFTFQHILVSFIIFRILDIWKPSIIGWADRELPGAWGTLVDDVIAGVAAALLSWLIFQF